MQIKLPTAVLTALQVLNVAGYEAYVVGGCVRDSLMGHMPKDWDIATSATPQEMSELFVNYHTVETGLKHGTLTVIIDNMPLEITTFRIDGIYSDGRHPDSVSFSRHLSEDLQRRDFTINAMAYHPNSGLIDLYGGQTDIQTATIRCVGNPDARFSEDALRIIRALRFASVLDFRIEDTTSSSLHRLSSALSCVAVERITTEFCKLLCGKSAERVVREYFDILLTFIPEIDGANDFHLLSHVSSTSIPRLAALLWLTNLTPDIAVNILHRLRLDNHTIQSVKSLLSYKSAPYDTESQILHLLNRLGRNLIWTFLSLRESSVAVRVTTEKLIEERRCYKLSMLAVNGNDLIEAGLSKGPAIGDALNALLYAVMDGACPNNKGALLSYLPTIKTPVQ